MKKLGRKINTTQESIEAYVYCEAVCSGCPDCGNSQDASYHGHNPSGTYSHY